MVKHWRCSSGRLLMDVCVGWWLSRSNIDNINHVLLPQQHQPSVTIINQNSGSALRADHCKASGWSGLLQDTIPTGAYSCLRPHSLPGGILLVQLTKTMQELLMLLWEAWDAPATHVRDITLLIPGGSIWFWSLGYATNGISPPGSAIPAAELQHSRTWAGSDVQVEHGCFPFPHSCRCSLRVPTKAAKVYASQYAHMKA